MTRREAADTIAAIATPPGRGAIAIVRASGPLVRRLASSVFRSNAPLNERVATTGRVVDARGATIDAGLALLFRRPHSYTGEDVLELHVHGSPAVAHDTLTALLEAGARLAGPGEFTRRALIAGKLDLSEAEAVCDLIAAEHRSAARAAAARLAGGISTEVARIGSIISAVLEELAAAVDFPDEVEPPDRDDLRMRLAHARAGLEALARTWEHGRLVRDGVTVAIVGAPNAGKSSLLNALLGVERALVSAEPGTTRDTIEELLACDGFVARIVDTAGIRKLRARGVETAQSVEAAGIARSEAALASARIALVVVDASRPLSDEAAAILARTKGHERVVFYNKADLGRMAFDARDQTQPEAMLGSAFEPSSIARVKESLRTVVLGDERIDLERPSLANARQADAVIAASRALRFADQTLASGAPTDLLAGDLMAATRALGDLTGAQASEAVLDAIFARFCIGK